ncbi:MAG: hypothetical protein KKB81_07270 [Candidatus Margulisbacteria bacterium]|nr:hypothetical protein [Candidatus Margulisiibacteriota bacterium]MBU1021155.1 hypothetical protein [Candidatus Margulisiibacteriota bacterium]MBU1729761.1 hypothetical protein [Candidatus Margulisiibacteriota bacterium]MBU1955262.1 hypothetical protein [Candidatus Margulisiibacteriota bacterium]
MSKIKGNPVYRRMINEWTTALRQRSAIPAPRRSGAITSSLPDMSFGYRSDFVINRHRVAEGIFAQFVEQSRFCLLDNRGALSSDIERSPFIALLRDGSIILTGTPDNKNVRDVVVHFTPEGNRWRVLQKCMVNATRLGEALTVVRVGENSPRINAEVLEAATICPPLRISLRPTGFHAGRAQIIGRLLNDKGLI